MKKAALALLILVAGLPLLPGTPHHTSPLAGSPHPVVHPVGR
jgi:hypothetical protein